MIEPEELERYIGRQRRRAEKSTLLAQLRERAGLDPLCDDEIDPAPASEHPDAPQSEDDRYAIYSVRGFDRARPGDEAGPRDARRRVAETSRDGIGTCLVTLREEGQITNDTRIGILDRLDRTWIVNPWARGDA